MATEEEKKVYFTRIRYISQLYEEKKINAEEQLTLHLLASFELDKIKFDDFLEYVLNKNDGNREKAL